MIITDKHKEALMRFMSSRAAAGEGSLKTWGAALKPSITGSQAEDVANALVADGLLVREARARGYVWKRKLSPDEAHEEPASSPPDLLDEPAPAGPILPPPPEPSAEVWKESAHRWEKKATSATEEAHELRERLERAEEHRSRLAVMVGLDETALWGPVMQAARQKLTAPCQRCVDLTRERNALGEELGQGLGDALQRTAELAREVVTLRQERDLAQGEAFDLRGRIEGWREQLVIVTRERDEALAEAQSLTAQARPAIDPGAVGQYLLTLPGDRWEALTLARQHLAEARTLAARAQEMEAAALAAVDGLLDTPAGQAPVEPPPPPVEAPPPPAPSGETVREEEPAPPSGEGLRLPPVGTLQYDVLQVLLKRGKGDAQTLATKLHEPKMRVSSALAILAKRGILVRTTVGLYEPAPALRRAS